MVCSVFFFFKQKTAYERRISDWSSDVCSSDLLGKADGTINRYLSHLRTFLVWAKKRKYRSAPVEGEDGVEFSWREESAGRIRWITRDEEAQLKDLLPDNVWKLVKVAIETGCRRDELWTVELEIGSSSGGDRVGQ